MQIKPLIFWIIPQQKTLGSYNFNMNPVICVLIIPQQKTLGSYNTPL